MKRNFLNTHYINNIPIHYYGDISHTHATHILNYMYSLNHNDWEYKINKFRDIHNNKFPYYHPLDHYHLIFSNSFKQFPDYYVGLQFSKQPATDFSFISNEIIKGVRRPQYISNYLRIYDSKLIKIDNNILGNSLNYVNKNKFNFNDYVINVLDKYIEK